MKFVLLFVCLSLFSSMVFGELMPCGALKKEDMRSCADLNGFKSEGLIDVSRVDSDFKKMCCKSLCGDKNNQYNVKDQGFYIQRDDGSSEYKVRIYFNKNDDCVFRDMVWLANDAVSKDQDESNPKGEYLQHINEDTMMKIHLSIIE